jgi:Cupin domain
VNEVDDDGRLPFLGGRLPAAFERRSVVVPPGDSRPYDRTEWQGAIVVVEHGTVELECVRGGRRRFERGDVLWLDGLPLRALHNPGEQDAVLVAIARRPDGAAP